MRSDYITDTDRWNLIPERAYWAPRWARWVPHRLRQRIWIPIPDPLWNNPYAKFTLKPEGFNFEEWRS